MNLKQTVFTILLISLTFYDLKAQSKKELRRPDSSFVEVTFKCKSCEEKNRFLIKGIQQMEFKNLKFPLVRKLNPGLYDMTYWQNKVQQIHLPFHVYSDSTNVITVK